MKEFTWYEQIPGFKKSTTTKQISYCGINRLKAKESVRAETAYQTHKQLQSENLLIHDKNSSSVLLHAAHHCCWKGKEQRRRHWQNKTEASIKSSVVLLFAGKIVIAWKLTIHCSADYTKLTYYYYYYYD